MKMEMDWEIHVNRVAQKLSEVVTFHIYIRPQGRNVNECETPQEEMPPVV